MSESPQQITTPDGICDAFAYMPAAGTPKSGVLLIPDAAGSRTTFRQMAQRIADAGYTVLLPNLYYRVQPAPQFEVMPASFADPEVGKKMMGLVSSVPPDAVARDTAAYVDYLTGPLGVTGKIGAVGYCMGGAIALRAAVARPQRVAAVASFHGGHLATDADSSPHKLLPSIKAQLYFAHADNDSFMPAGRITQLEAALAAAGSRCESEVYPGAQHGFAVKDNPSFDEAACQRHWDKMLELFGSAL